MSFIAFEEEDNKDDSNEVLMAKLEEHQHLDGAIECWKGLVDNSSKPC
jgi:hypothetical protein